MGNTRSYVEVGPEHGIGLSRASLPYKQRAQSLITSAPILSTNG